MKPRSFHVCSDCGGRYTQWRGQCPGCGAWGTLEKKSEAPAKPGRTARPVTVSAPESLGAAKAGDAARAPSGMPEVDEVLGGGLVPGQAILLAGEPGIGKSTLLLQLAGMAAGKARSLYVSAEESLPQLADRAARLGLPAGDIRALATARADDALAVLQGPEPPDFLVLDSVQTMAVDELDGLPGSVSQVRAVAAATVEAAKRSGAVLLLVGHVTKEGQIAGPKLLEHMVDTVLSLEGDRNHVFRVLRVLKNRFGPGQETLVLSMDGAGLKPVSDPSAYFLEDRDAGVSGSAVVMTAEGRRPFAVEVQALASRSFLSIPRRTALGFDANRLNLLLAVMEKRLKLSFAQADIYAKTGGGLRVADPGLDLGICASVLSSFYDLPLPAEAVFWGEVDLSGRARPVNGGDLRARQAEKLGYGRVYSSDTCRDLAELQRKLFGKG